MVIREVKPSQRVQGRWLVTLEDGSLLRVSEGEVVSFALCAGRELDEDTLDRLTASARQSQTRHRALNMASARPLSKKELVDKLARKDADRDGAQQAADWLEGLGLLNDREYAVTLVRHYAAKGFGVKKLRDELYRRGVPREFWDEALAQAGSPEDTLDRLVQKRLGGQEPTRENLKKISDYLARRGFSWSDISAALRRCGGEGEDD
jgi:regulatory protein